MAIIVGTANIQNEPDLSHFDVIRCGILIGEKKPDFVGFQELVEKTDHRDILIGLGPNYALTDKTQCAIAYNYKKWTLVHHVAEMATPGVDGITPNLYSVNAVFKRRVPMGQTVAVNNNHLVPLTLHGRKRDNYGHRLDMWRNHWSLTKKIVSDNPCPTFVTGDFNNILFHFGIGDLLISKGLDKIFGVGKGKNIQVLDRFSVTDPSDHDAQFVKVRVKR